MYKLFDKQVGTENYAIISNYIDDIYKSFESGISNNKKYKDMSDRCISMAPDTDEYDTLEAIIAQNVAISLAYVLLYIIDNNDGYIEDCYDIIIDIKENLYFNKYGFYENADVENEELCIEDEFILLLQQPININNLRKFNNINSVRI